MILLNPGPVNTTARVTAAMSRGDLCHREPEFSDLLDAVRTKLVRAFVPGADWVAVPLTGSGTLALESAVSSSVAPGRKMLVLENGVYGARIHEMARAHDIETVALQWPWTEMPDPARVEEALTGDPAIEVVAVVHHETTTGLINPIEEIGAIVRSHGRRLLVDSISGLAGDPIDLEGWGVDICVGVANKCIQGIPGVGFVLARRSELQRMSGLAQRSLYLHLPRHFQAHERRTVPFTPAIQAFYAFDEALDELLEETVAGRISRYGAAAAQLRKGFEGLGLEILVPAGWRSNSITTLGLPGAITYGELHDRLRDDGFVIYEGQGLLETTAFRVANMGAIDPADFARFLDSLGRALA